MKALLMKKLLWKDLHINRALLYAVGFGLALPYMLVAIITVVARYRYNDHESLPLMLVYAGLWGLALGILIITLLSGNAVAGERAERSAEFLASVPVSRRAIITSKVLVVLAAGALIWLVNLGVVYSVTAQSLPEEFRERWEPDPSGAYRLHALRIQQAEIVRTRDDMLPVLALTALLAWGLAWGCSCYLRSPVLSACAGLAAPIVLAMLLAIVSSFWPEGFRPGPWYALVCVILGAAGCGGGTWHYLRRVEP